MKFILLRDARRRKKLTQEQLADASGVDQTTISRLETDAHPNPTERTKERLAEALGIRPVQLRFSAPSPKASISKRGDREGHRAASPAGAL